jgi:hypothetical protein
MRKTDEDKKRYFRTGDRVYRQNGRWFFTTREDDHGPYPTREAAELDLSRYVDEMEHFEDVKEDLDTPVQPQQPADDLRILDRDEDLPS